MFANRLPQNLRVAGILLALVAGMLATSSCNTWRGAGKDVERAGEKMQDK